MATTNVNYLQILTQAGLKGDQAIVYEALLKNGPKKASQLPRFVPFKRSLAYKILNELVEMGLVIKKEEPHKVAVFEPAHPLKIKDWVAKQQEQYKNADLALTGFLPKLVSDFNLTLGMPGIQIYEGLEGAQKILADSLTASTEIYSYIDNEAVNKLYPDINKQYVGQRSKSEIKKKMITVDSAYIRDHAKSFDKTTTTVRVINSPAPFTTIMQIYDTKVSYITLQGKTIISVLIDNPNISKMHKMLFETMWQTAKPVA
jgi:predicted transcriptional regulator